jgi:hypothetical protein
MEDSNKIGSVLLNVTWICDRNEFEEAHRIHDKEIAGRLMEPPRKHYVPMLTT